MKTTLFIALLLFAASTVKAQQSVVAGSKPGWYKIAEKTVDFTPEGCLTPSFRHRHNCVKHPA